MVYTFLKIRIIATTRTILINIFPIIRLLKKYLLLLLIAFTPMKYMIIDKTANRIVVEIENPVNLPTSPLLFIIIAPNIKRMVKMERVV